MKGGGVEEPERKEERHKGGSEELKNVTWKEEVGCFFFCQYFSVQRES